MENILMFQPRKEQMFTLLNVLIFKNKKKLKGNTHREKGRQI